MLIDPFIPSVLYVGHQFMKLLSVLFLDFFPKNRYYRLRKSIEIGYKRVSIILPGYVIF